MKGPYDAILNLPHHVSETRPQMSMEKRAPQFMPFAALTGYDAAIWEAARLTDARVELGENAVDALDMKFSILLDVVETHPEIAVTYFLPDERKEGGRYVTLTGRLKRIDEVEKAVILTDRTTIPIRDILDMGSGVFDGLL